MSYYEYKNYDDLLNDISSGSYIVNQPMNSNGKQISFLNKLLEFSNIDQDNLHKIIQDILNRIKHSILLEKKKDSVKNLLKHVEGEWDENKTIFSDNDFNCMNQKCKYKTQAQKYEDLSSQIEQKMSEKGVFSKFLKEEDMEDYSNLELFNLGDESLRSCENLLKEIDNDLIKINDEIQKIENIDLSFILDLSLKHIELYKCFDKENKDTINEKINNIFLNYALIISLLKKQYNHTRMILLEIKMKMSEKCNFMKDTIKQLRINKGNNQTFEFF